MPVYSATFSGVTVSGVTDLFEITAPNTPPNESMVLIREIVVGQYAEPAAELDEWLSIQVIRGHTTSGSGGIGPVPTNFNPRSRAALSTVEANNSTIATAGSPVILLADIFNLRAGWVHRPPDRRGCILLDAGQRLVVRFPIAPVDPLTVNGTLIFEEVGKNHPY